MQKAENEKLTLGEFLDELSSLVLKEKEPDVNAVHCMTIHRAQGLQFDHVYLIGMVVGHLPAQSALDAQHKDNTALVEEQRRLCFVAQTRAVETVTLTYAKKYASNEPTRMVSPFLLEMGYMDIDNKR